MKKAIKVEEKIQEEVVERNLKLEGSVNLLIEKLTQAGIDLEGKEIIIKDKKLTVK